MTNRKDDDTNFVDGDEIRLVNNSLARSFNEVKTSTTGGTVMEHNNFVGPTSTMMRVLTSKEGDLQSCFDKIDETQNNNTTLKQKIIEDHGTAINKGKFVGILPLECVSGFYKTF